MRSDLVGAVRATLARAGFRLSESADARPVTFDVIARRDERLLIVKVLTNVDSLSEALADEMKVLARFLGATPLLVGERSSSRELEDGAMYQRHGINILTLGTLGEVVEDGVEPLVYAAPGGFYVNLDGVALRRLREARGLSLGQLAEVAGVSRRAIAMYEEGMAAMVDVAAKLEDFLAEPLVKPLDPFAKRGEEGAPSREAVVDLERLQAGFEREALSLMAGIGFRVAPLGRLPFNAVARENAEPSNQAAILAGVVPKGADARPRAAALADLADVTLATGVFIVERRTTRLSIEGTAIVGRDELAKLDGPTEFAELLKERRGRTR
ncbi:MAG TPA: transcriptional regulator [Candidatus Thermoplasmatota archaeon]|nr:transcriptional regulator [Candidatus Thermoplasmatota archaeon]